MKSYIKRVIRLISAREPNTLLLLILILSGSWCFIELAGDVFEGDTRAFDEYLLNALRDPEHPELPIGVSWLHEAARDVTALGSVTVLLLFTFSVALYLILEAKTRMMLFLILATSSGMLLSFFLKNIFKRPRPEVVPHLAQVYTTSFPSSHALMSAVVYLTLGVLLSSVVASPRLKAYVLTVAIFFSVVVGVSRVYLGVHYPTDVVAGWIAGLVWALFCWGVGRTMQQHGAVEAEN